MCLQAQNASGMINRWDHLGEKWDIKRPTLEPVSSLPCTLAEQPRAINYSKIFMDLWGINSISGLLPPAAGADTLSGLPPVSREDKHMEWRRGGGAEAD